MTRMLNEKDRATLFKIRRLFDSPIPGEASAARGRAAILAKHGLKLADLEAALDARPENNGPASSQSGFTFYDMKNPEHVRAWREVKAQQGSKMSGGGRRRSRSGTR
jgi:hypothetical protein